MVCNYPVTQTFNFLELQVSKSNSDSAMEIDMSLEMSRLAGKKLASPPPGDEIVISGMAGWFPDSDNVQHFAENLYNKVDLVTADNRRWAPSHPEIPQRTGKINNASKFDASFFGVHHRQAQNMDPMLRLLSERTFEALIDAGINPGELKGTKTGVFIGTSFSETEKTAFYENRDHQNYGIIGTTRSMIAHRISYFLQIDGPSYVCDTACSGSLFAMEHAYKALREGQCETALVGGVNLCLHPIISLQFARLGVLSADGSCKCFDESANGYARSEGIVILILQKAKHARRIYAQVLHSKTNCDGFKEQGITYPSGQVQQELLDEFYAEAGVEPQSLSYVEAHGTGTKVGDPEELATLDNIFCKGRKRPLLIGSVKSNIGHNEPASGMSAIIKCLIGMETGYIPPNINYNKVRIGVEGLEVGRMKVVSEKTPFPDDPITVGINSFGFGGANGHVLLRSTTKKKFNNGLPKDELPRLVCLSARTEESMNCFIKDLSERSLDVENVRMFHEIFKTVIPGFNQRSYIILSKNGVLGTNFQFFDEHVKPVYCVFGGVNCINVGAELFRLPAFAAHIQRISTFESLTKSGVNIIDTVTNCMKDNEVATVAIQTGLYEILKMLNVSFEGFAGTFVGELSAAYADGVITLEQALLAAHQVATNKSPKALAERLTTIFQQSNKSTKWISSPTDIIQHFVRVLLNKEEVPLNLPRRAIALEIGCVNVEAPFVQTVQLLPRDADLKGFLEGLGQLYQAGIELELDKIYPAVQWPVSRGTPKISPCLKWQHSRDYFVFIYKENARMKCGHRLTEVVARYDEWQFIKGHVIDGRLLFAATGYLTSVWETLAVISSKLIEDMKVVFTKVKFNRACTVPPKGSLELQIMIQRGTGKFEIVEGDDAVVTGFVNEVESMEDHWGDIPLPAEPYSSTGYEMSSKDIYKELRLRGYNYKDQFKMIQSFNTKTNTAEIPWKENWTTFMDNMIQVQILGNDSRSLFVPTRMECVLMDPQKHIAYAKSLGENPVMPVYYNKDLDVLRCGGIEFRGVDATSITKRKQADPVMETYQFVPNNCELDLELAVRCAMQLVLEISPSIKIKGVELLDEFARKGDAVLAPIIFAAFADQPMIEQELYVFSKEIVEVDCATVEDKQIGLETECQFIVGTGLLQRSKVLPSIMQSLKQNGFIISREDVSEDANPDIEDLIVVATYNTGKERLVLLRKNLTAKPTAFIKIDNDELSWLPATQRAVKSRSNVILYTSDENSGVLGLVNCLRREPNVTNVSCFFMDKAAPEFDPNSTFYKHQIDKNMPFNLLRNGVWGTYRHLPLKISAEIEAKHCVVNSTVRGDLNKIRWVQGNISSETKLKCNQLLVYNYVCSLNFRDIMMASGKLAVESISQNRLEQDSILGFEFAGCDEGGRRVMGMRDFNAMATITVADKELIWEIPDNWTMEEAATVPCVYATVLLSLIHRCNMKRGQSILIHSATGGIGLAALNVCLHYGCTIYCTVGTEEKREFLRRNYPQLDQNNIGNSRDTSFEQLVMKRTNGRGVDIVLNSLAEEKLQASIRCVAKNGHFVEIGKFDMSNDSPLQLDMFERCCTFHGVMLDTMFTGSSKLKKVLFTLVNEGVQQGYVKPLPTTVFDKYDVVSAFRYMTTGKHIGKVVLRVRDNDETVEVNSAGMTKCLPRVYADPNKVYIIVGGLGGFGLELADWLVIRGARKLVLASRSGITKGYQSYRINLWKSYGVAIQISNDDITTPSGVQNLLNNSNALGQVDAIFNLAVVLHDTIFENQTAKIFQTSLNPKAVATKHLDEYSRKLCPTLRHFVVFSSVSCGRGNAGQTNYGMANSIMERICEQRKKDGLPGLAIQWGAVGDVGLIADKAEDSIEVVIGGTHPQKIVSCLEALDTFMRHDAPVVSCIVVAEKKSPGSTGDTIVESVAFILGLKDLKNVSLHLTFPELGMDSMMAVEIKQMLEREYEVFLTPQDMRAMTFARLSDIAMEKTMDQQEEGKNNQDSNVIMLLRYIPIESESEARVVELPTQAVPDGKVNTLIFLPGIQGSAQIFKNLASKLTKFKALSFQYDYNSPTDGISAIASYVAPLVEEIAKKEGRFFIAAHSYGTFVAVEVAHIVRQRGHRGHLFLLDGSPRIMKAIIETYFDVNDEDMFQAGVLGSIMSVYMSADEVISHKKKILELTTFDDRILYVISISPKNLPHRPEYLFNISMAAYHKIKSAHEYKHNFEKLDCTVSLFKAKIAMMLNAPEDYGLSECIGNSVSVKLVEGDHATMVESDALAAAIDEVVNEVPSGKLVKMEETPVVVKHTVM